LSATNTLFYYPAPGFGFVTSSATFGNLQINIAGTFTSVAALTTGSWAWVCLDGLTTRFLDGSTINNIVVYRILQLIPS
jgi:hypothetical protein